VRPLQLFPKSILHRLTQHNTTLLLPLQLEPNTPKVHPDTLELTQNLIFFPEEPVERIPRFLIVTMSQVSLLCIELVL
jgi:hypothetical protein